MRTAIHRTAACLALAAGTLWGAPTRAADFSLSDAESRRVEARGIVVRANLDSSARRGTVRAAVLIDAPPEVVFDMMTSCTDALAYVPHLRLCRVLDRAADGTWQLVEHRIDFGWYAPAVEYVFRADFVPQRSIAFRQISGDFKANQGVWEFEPQGTGARTLLRYRVFIDPPGFIPNWLARSTFKRELPQLLTDLRLRCESEQRRRAQAAASP